MTEHVRTRLLERYNMPPREFLDGYGEALRNNLFFKKEYQEERYPDSVRICMKIHSKLVVVVLDKRDGSIFTVMKPQRTDYAQAKQLKLI